MIGVTIQGCDFLIDTMDWHNPDDAALVAEDIATQMRLWTQEEAKKYHMLLIQADEGEVEYDHPELKAVDEMCCECASKILDTYDNTSNLAGHNYSIHAQKEVPTHNPNGEGWDIH